VNIFVMELVVDVAVELILDQASSDLLGRFFDNEVVDLADLFVHGWVDIFVVELVVNVVVELILDQACSDLLGRVLDELGVVLNE